MKKTRKKVARLGTACALTMLVCGCSPVAKTYGILWGGKLDKNGRAALF
jgi:hypothetical protein